MQDSAGTDKELDVLFQRHWALKEAFVKARGDGIAFGLRNAEFDFGGNPWNNAPHLRLHGIRQDTFSIATL